MIDNGEIWCKLSALVMVYNHWRTPTFHLEWVFNPPPPLRRISVWTALFLCGGFPHRKECGLVRVSSEVGMVYRVLFGNFYLDRVNWYNQQPQSPIYQIQENWFKQIFLFLPQCVTYTLITNRCQQLYWGRILSWLRGYEQEAKVKSMTEDWKRARRWLDDEKFTKMSAKVILLFSQYSIKHNPSDSEPVRHQHRVRAIHLPQGRGGALSDDQASHHGAGLGWDHLQAKQHHHREEHQPVPRSRRKRTGFAKLVRK